MDASAFIRGWGTSISTRIGAERGVRVDIVFAAVLRAVFIHEPGDRVTNLPPSSIIPSG